MSDSNSNFVYFFIALVLTASSLISSSTYWMNSLDIYNERSLHSAAILPQALETQPNLANRWFANTAMVSPAPVWIIGTSISFRGFDPCQDPNLANFSRPGQGVSDVIDWLPQALLRSGGPTEIILDASLFLHSITRPLEMSADTYARVFAFVYLLPQDSPIRGFFTSGRCTRHLVGHTPTPFVLRASEDNPERMRQQSAPLIEALTGWCMEQGGRSVTLAIFPINPSMPSELRNFIQTQLFEVSQGQLAAISDLAPECGTLWAPELDAYDASDWYDLNHFAPNVGSSLLADRSYGWDR